MKLSRGVGTDVISVGTEDASTKLDVLLHTVSWLLHDIMTLFTFFGINISLLCNKYSISRTCYCTGWHTHTHTHIYIYIYIYTLQMQYLLTCTVVRMWPLAYLDFGFESNRDHGCLVSFERCVLSGGGPCVGLITCPEESYRVWCVWMLSWILNNVEAMTR